MDEANYANRCYPCRENFTRFQFQSLLKRARTARWNSHATSRPVETRRAEPRQPVFSINPERHFISHNSSRLAVSRAVRVFREKPSEKFSRAVPKFALASVTSITPRVPLDPLATAPSIIPALSLVRIVRDDLRFAPAERTVDGGETTRPAHSGPHSARLPPATPRHVTRSPPLGSAVSLARPFGTFPYLIPVPPSPPPSRSHSQFFAPIVVWPPRPSRRRVLARRPARHSVAKSARAFPP